MNNSRKSCTISFLKDWFYRAVSGILVTIVLAVCLTLSLQSFEKINEKYPTYNGAALGALFTMIIFTILSTLLYTGNNIWVRRKGASRYKRIKSFYSLNPAASLGLNENMLMGNTISNPSVITKCENIISPKSMFSQYSSYSPTSQNSDQRLGINYGYIFKLYISSIFGLNLDSSSRTQSTEGQRKILLKIICLALLWSISLYLFIYCIFNMIPSIFITLYSSHLTFTQSFGWVLLHERFWAHKIVALILMLTSVVLLTHFKGEFLKYLGDVLLAIVSALTFSLYKIYCRKTLESPFIPNHLSNSGILYNTFNHNDSIKSNYLATSQNYIENNPNNKTNDNTTSQYNFPTNSLTDYKEKVRISNAVSYPNLQIPSNNVKFEEAKMDLRPSPTFSIPLRTDSPSILRRFWQNQTLILRPKDLNFDRYTLFYVIFGFFITILFLVLTLLLVFTKAETVPSTLFIWKENTLSTLYLAIYLVVVEVGPILVSPIYIYLGICLSTIGNIVLDFRYYRLVPNTMLQIAFSSAILSYIILLFPDDWQNYTDKIFTIRKRSFPTSTLKSFSGNAQAYNSQVGLGAQIPNISSSVSTTPYKTNFNQAINPIINKSSSDRSANITSNPIVTKVRKSITQEILHKVRRPGLLFSTDIPAK